MLFDAHNHGFRVLRGPVSALFLTDRVSLECDRRAR